MERIFRIIVSDDADIDLIRITKSLSENNAIKFSEELLQKYDNLKLMPMLYQRIYYEKKTKTDYRRIVHRKFIVIYKIQKNQITILRIVSEKENYIRSNYLNLNKIKDY